jgi:hypothetical protein
MHLPAARESSAAARPSAAFWLQLILLVVAGFGLPVPAARAELVVLNGGSGGGHNGQPAVFRFDDATGARVGVFGYESEAFYSMTLTSGDEICVNSNILGDHQIYRFNPNGTFVGAVGSAPAGHFSGMLRGRDGNLYSLMQVSDFSYQPGPWQIVRFDRPTPTVLVPSGRGGMTAPVTMVLGPDGRLYVADTAAGILRFDAATGAFVDVFVPNGRGGMPRPTRLAFGADGRLYVSSDTGNAVYRFDAATGAFVDVFVTPGSGGLSNPCGLAFGPDGNLCVVSRGTKQVLRFHGATGNYQNVAAAHSELLSPVDVAFTRPRTESVWFDDSVPAGAITNAPWIWSAQSPAPFSGTQSHRSATGSGVREHSFNFAADRLQVGAGDSVFFHVYLENHQYGAGEIMVSWGDGQGWEHRVYWGSDAISYGQNGTAGRRYMGTLPRTGWTRLEIPAEVLGLAGRSVQGMSFAADNVTAAWDRIGKTTRATAAPASDTQPPFVAISEPGAGATVSGMMSIVANGGDNIGVTRVEFFLDGDDRTVLVDHPPSPWRTAWDTRAFSNGTHTLKVVVRDAAGNHATDTRTITVHNTDDVTYPTITLTSPTNNSTVSGDVAVQAQASDNVGVERVEFEANGTLIGADNTAPYSVTWNSRSLPDGNYTLVARANDAAGNINAVTAAITVANAAPPPSSTGSSEIVWVEDGLPAGAWGGGSGGDGWNWVTANPAPFSGTRAHQSSNSTGLHDHGFNGASQPLAVQSGEQLMVYVYLDPANTPRSIMVSWMDGTSWDHRAYWGADAIPYGTPNTPGRFRAGDLPAAGGWVRLTVPAAAVALEGRQISGMSFILSNGRATWDRAGKIAAGSTPPPPPPPPGGTTPDVTIWMEGNIPVGASPSAMGGDAWTWNSNPSPSSPSGLRVHQSAPNAGYHEHSFNFAWYPLAIATGDSIFVYVLLDPARPPREIILSWCDGSNWEHRAYWGENVVGFGTNNTPSRRYMGPIPSTGGWVQLQIPASQVGLEGRSIHGMAFGLVDGQASWDTMGKVTP